MKSIKLYLALFVLIITQLHLLRNITSLYLALYGVAAVFSLCIFSSSFRFYGRDQKILLSFILMLFTIPCFSVLYGVVLGYYHGIPDVLAGVSRLLFSLPIYLSVLSIPFSAVVSRKLFLTAGVLTFFASSSIIYQFVQGPIWWFAESSERSGIDRYASLFGSLTALGVVCGVGLLSLAVSVRSKVLFFCLIAFIICGSVLSLQKAAVVNVVLALMLTLYFRGIGFVQVLLGVAVFSLLSLLMLPVMGDQFLLYLESFRVFDEKSSGFTDDVSLVASILDRILELPLVAIDYFGVDSLFWGVGPVGASGSLGFPEVPMTHNGIVDIFLVGGMGYFLFFVLLFAFVLYGYRKNASFSASARVGIVILLLMILNSAFSGLLVFSPSGAMFFAISLRAIFENNHHMVRYV